MANRTVHLRVLTPNKVKLDGEFEQVIVRTIEGDKGILAGHEAYAAALGMGSVRAVNGPDETLVAVLGGFVSVRNDTVIILSPIADTPEQIDAVVAQIARERADNKLSEQAADLEMRRAEMALRRSLVKNDVSAFSILRSAADNYDDSE